MTTPHTEHGQNGHRPLADASQPRYVLRLYVSGMTPRSTEAISKIKVVCEQHLSGRYELEVVDLFQQPAQANAEQIVATPTLIKKLPLPLRRLVGDLSDTDRVVRGLNLIETREAQS